MLLTRWKTAFATALCTAAFSQAILAQVAPPTILTIDLENFVIDQADIPDATKFSTNPNVTPSAILGINDFFGETLLADIVAVNGQPAKGTVCNSGADHQKRTQLPPRNCPERR